MNLLTPTTIQELHDFLMCLKPEVTLCPGLTTPHIYRGGALLALVPTFSTTVGELLGQIQTIMTNGVPDLRGRPYRLDECSEVYVAQQHHYGQVLTLGALLNSVDPWIGIGEGFGR
jgi:hypothetical protein